MYTLDIEHRSKKDQNIYKLISYLPNEHLVKENKASKININKDAKEYEVIDLVINPYGKYNKKDYTLYKFGNKITNLAVNIVDILTSEFSIDNLLYNLGISSIVPYDDKNTLDVTKICVYYNGYQDNRLFENKNIMIRSLTINKCMYYDNYIFSKIDCVNLVELDDVVLYSKPLQKMYDNLNKESEDEIQKKVDIKYKDYSKYIVIPLMICLVLFIIVISCLKITYREI